MRGLLLHVPKGFASPDWRHNYINIMPMGLFAIAHLANRHGHDVRVMNASIHGDTETALALILERMQQRDVGVVGLSMHWHLSTWDACAVAERIRQAAPGCRIVAGGLTATCFATELLERCPALDAVVRGDGEVPFLGYLDAVERGASPEQLIRVPNLVWRDHERIVRNELSYVADSAALSALDFGVTAAICDLAEYANGPAMFQALGGQPFDLAGEPTAQKAFFLNIGRGCTMNCIYCAGSQASFKNYCGRDDVAVRSIESVLGTVRDAAANGFRKLHICFDLPSLSRSGYFEELFARIHDEISAELVLIFESYALPARSFLETCQRAFDKTVLILSPCFFHREGMEKFKGYRYSREELEATLAQLEACPSITPFVYYAITPLEDWDRAALRGHVVQMKQLKRRFGCQVSAMPILAEPGSPWVSLPELFPGHHLPLDFADFWREWQRPLDRWSPTLCGLASIDEIFAEIGSLQENDSFP